MADRPQAVQAMATGLRLKDEKPDRMKRRILHRAHHAWVYTLVIFTLTKPLAPTRRWHGLIGPRWSSLRKVFVLLEQVGGTSSVRSQCVASEDEERGEHVRITRAELRSNSPTPHALDGSDQAPRRNTQCRQPVSFYLQIRNAREASRKLSEKNCSTSLNLTE